MRNGWTIKRKPAEDTKQKKSYRIESPKFKKQEDKNLKQKSVVKTLFCLYSNYMLTYDEFERLVKEGIDVIDEKFLQKLKNVEIVIEDNFGMDEKQVREAERKR